MTQQQRWVLSLASLAAFMISLDSLVVSTAMPTIHRDLHTSLGSLEWTVSAYNLAFAVLIMTSAALGDRFGRRLLFISGLGLFTLASVACAAAPGIDALITARAVQGAGASMVMPMALTQISAAFTPAERGRALGIFIGIAGLATFLGPVIGGVLSQELTWRWIFWVNVPIGVIAIVLARLRIPESSGPNRQFDLAGVALITLGALGLVWGLVVASTAGWGSVEVVSTLAAGAVGTVAFLLWERQAPAPLLPMRFFRIRAFTGGNIAGFFLFAQIYGSSFMLAQFLQNAQGYSPLGAGLRMMPLTGTVLVIGPIAGLLADKFGERALVVGGMVLQAAGTAWVGFDVTAHIGYAALILPLAICGCGSVLAIPSTQKAVVSSVELKDIGKASGSVTMLRYFGGVFGIAILSTVFAARGGYGSPTAFANGFGPVLFTLSGFSLLSALAGLGIPAHQRAPGLSRDRGAGKVSAAKQG